MLGLFKKKGPTIEERLAVLEEQKAEAEREVIVLRQKLDEHEAKRTGIEPWVEIVGESIDPVKGIEIKLDWNQSFIKYLVENGIEGDDEEIIVQKWLALLYQNLFHKLEDKNSDKTDTPYI